MVVLWPYEGRVMGSKLDRHELTFILISLVLEGMWEGKGKPGIRRSQGAEKPSNNYHLWMRIKHTIKPFFVSAL